MEVSVFQVILDDILYNVDSKIIPCMSDKDLFTDMPTGLLNGPKDSVSGTDER
jgi:hypothetical protein